VAISPYPPVIKRGLLENPPFSPMMSDDAAKKPPFSWGFSSLPHLMTSENSNMEQYGI